MAKAVKKPGHSPSTGIRNRNLGTRKVRACDLVQHPLNWRQHPKSQQDALRGVLNEVGFVGTLLAYELPDGRLQLIDGHLRSDVMPNDEVDVMVTDLSESEAAKVLATHDPLAAMAEADADKLDALLRDVQTGDEALAAMLEELAADSGVLDGMASGEVTEDESPEPPVEPVSRTGDMWILGEHRLLCGDSTKAEDVARLMGSERAGLMNTDPPYGVAYANDDRPNPGVAKPRVANDGLSDEKLQAFLEACFRSATGNALKDDAAWYLWHAHLTQGYFAAAAAAAANVILHRQIIWVKPVLLLGRGQYHWKHEPCFMGWVEGNQPPDYGLGNGERTQTTIWEIGSVPQAERRELNHSTPKPIGLFSIPIVKHLKPGEVCYEPFSGSGPQIIAAEQTKRRCFAIEIEPCFVDCGVERWQRLTNREAILESTGKTFSETGRERCV